MAKLQKKSTLVLTHEDETALAKMCGVAATLALAKNEVWCKKFPGCENCPFIIFCRNDFEWEDVLEDINDTLNSKVKE